VVGADPVNDETLALAARKPRVSFGDDGELLVAYLEWDGTGDPLDAWVANYHVRVKQLLLP
jgi:hypothetical protein